MAEEDDLDWLVKMQQHLARNRAYAKSEPYFTTLSPEQEPVFREWVTKNAIPFNPDDPISDYDMRGYWVNNGAVPAKKGDHFPDTYKTPYHQSFSAESVYALPNAPVWRGLRLVDPKTGAVIFEEPPRGK